MSNDASQPVCTICLTPIEAGEAEVACPSCQAPYHAECWAENKGCGVYGCQQAPTVEPRGAMEIPVSHWGQQHKACPSCGQQIMAAAVRCKHCGVTFTTAQPEDSADFRARSAQESRLPGIKRGVVILFILCALPCLSPVGLVFGSIWYSLRRKDIKALPALYAALCKIGLILAALLTVGMTLAMFLYGVTPRR